MHFLELFKVETWNFERFSEITIFSHCVEILCSWWRTTSGKDIDLVLKREHEGQRNDWKPDQLNFTTCHSGIALAYYYVNDCPNALSLHEKALEICQQSLPPSHPDFVLSYKKIADVYYNMNDYPKTLSFYENALTIHQQSFPLNHPNISTSYTQIGYLYNKMGDYAKARSFHEMDRHWARNNHMLTDVRTYARFTIGECR